MTQRAWPRSARSFQETACFEPISLSASAMAAIAAATAVGTAVSALGAYQQGQTAKNVAEYNATVSNNNAIATELASAAESDKKERDSRRLIASGVAAAGASGVDPNSGSPLEVVADIAGQTKLDEELARWQARERAKGFANQANLDVYSGRAAARAGTINAGASILSGFGRAAGMFSGGGRGGG